LASAASSPASLISATGTSPIVTTVTGVLALV